MSLDPLLCNCSRLPWKQVHRHAYTLPQVARTCGRVKWPAASRPSRRLPEPAGGVKWQGRGHQDPPAGCPNLREGSSGRRHQDHPAGCPNLREGSSGRGHQDPPAGYPNLREGQVAGPGAFRRKCCYPNRERLPCWGCLHSHVCRCILMTDSSQPTDVIAGNMPRLCWGMAGRRGHHKIVHISKPMG